MGTSDIIKSHIRISDLISTGSSGNHPCPACGKNNLSTWGDERYKCWTPGCALSSAGDVISLYAYLHQVDNNRAYLELSKQYGERRARPSRGNMEQALSYWRTQLGYYEPAMKYLDARGWSRPLIRQYEIGYAPPDSSLQSVGISCGIGDTYFQNRIIFPLRSADGELVHMIGRYLGLVPDGVPRVKNTLGDANNYLWGEHRLATYDQDVLYITEGSPDALSLLSIGLPAVGVLGLAGIKNHVRKFSRFRRLVFACDNDRHACDHINPALAGKLKSWTALAPQLLRLQIELPETEIMLWMPPLSAGKDVNDMLVRCGGQRLLSSIGGGAANFVDLYIRSRASDYTAHLDILRLIKATGRGGELIRQYLPEDPLEYGLRIVGD